VRPIDHPLGAFHLGDGRTSFLVWAPLATRLEVVLPDDGRVVAAPAVGAGYHQVTIGDVAPGARYRYRLHRPEAEPVDRNDPASRWQPEGLHGPSAVDRTTFPWTDGAWRNPPLREHVLYELHVGTFTPEGTFDAAIGRLDDLRELGVTAIELMPIWQFPGERNWGYDGVLPYAAQHSYGGPDGLRRLVDAAHASGLAVFLDVVYNHFGPEGNHLPEFGPYLTDRHHTPWGQAVNVDGPDSDPVRRYLVENAVRWCTEFHIDGLRLDAVHAIIDSSAVHLLEELAASVHQAAERLGRRVQVIAESELSDPRLVRSRELGGYGLDGQWLDDVHHALHVALTGEREGYFGEYEGLPDLARALRDRYVFAGRYSPHRGRTIGRPAPDVPYERFIACTQNHDQVGNRMLGERASDRLDLESLKLLASALLLGPFTPMLWMGQEYAEDAPFQYFVSHTDPELVEAVRQGRRREFAYFADQGEAPDPQSPATFERSKLDWSLRKDGEHATVLALYHELLRLRREVPALTGATAGPAIPTLHGTETLSYVRTTRDDADAALVILHAGHEPRRIELTEAGPWELTFDTASPRWDGTGGTEVTAEGAHLSLQLRPRSAVLLTRRP
jgi:maltooligosyltrehalose trehalohydrolase